MRGVLRNDWLYEKTRTPSLGGLLELIPEHLIGDLMVKEHF